MSRWNNYGLGSRDMRTAGRWALERERSTGDRSYSGTATTAQRWEQFATRVYEQGIRRMEGITREQVIEYGRDLADRVDSGELKPATAQNYLSAVNSVLTAATHGRWESVGAVRDCDIPERSAIRESAPGAIDREASSRAVEAVADRVSERAAAVASMCRELGLRSKEASLLNARSAAEQAHESGSVTISDGTKGGRDREVPITSERQIEALERAAAAQGDDRSMIPREQSWQQWREGDLRHSREIVTEYTGGGLHDLRSAYACDRYAELTGRDAPVLSGQVEDREADRAAREAISAELGHGRIDVVSEYVGGRG
ncbi:integrase domain-containing protein [Guyparkeria sp. 1SP6A2]|nr:integrase domain-containing protein [Guyparkeria sp. 1SP6A2]